MSPLVPFVHMGIWKLCAVPCPTTFKYITLLLYTHAAHVEQKGSPDYCSYGEACLHSWLVYTVTWFAWLAALQQMARTLPL